MSATRIRDRIYSDLHRRTFKPRGYLKKGRWISRQEGLFHFALERPQHRWDTPESATLDPVAYIFHERFHALAIGWPTFPGVDRVSIPAFKRGVRWLADVSESFQHVRPDTDADSVLRAWQDALEGEVIPIFGRASTLQGLLSIVRERMPADRLRKRDEVILLSLLGARDEARNAFDELIGDTSGQPEREKALELWSRLVAFHA
jgi:hypothetical protein